VRTLSRLVLILSCAAVLVVPSDAQAALAILDSMEWIVGDSDFVIAGSVIKVEKRANSDNELFEVISVQVSRTFKGKPQNQVTFVQAEPIRPWDGPVAEGWLADGSVRVFCVVSRQRAKQDFHFPGCIDWVLRSGLSTFSPPDPKTGFGYPTRDMKILKDWNSILQVLEAAARDYPEGWERKCVTLGAPTDSAVFKLWYSGSEVWVNVPKDEKLEATAKQWCASDDTRLRVEGVWILRLYENDWNIAILQSLLHDPDFCLEPQYVQKPGQQCLEVVSYRRVCRPQGSLRCSPCSQGRSGVARVGRTGATAGQVFDGILYGLSASGLE
jgi:hypothetical protein